MIRIFNLVSLGSFLLFFALKSEAKSFVADCWASCDQVKVKDLNHIGGAAFQTYCSQHFKNGRILQDSNGLLMCIAPAYLLVRSDMVGEAENCPIMTPVQQRRWFARCSREADKVWPYGDQIGNCYTQRGLRPENIECNSF